MSTILLIDTENPDLKALADDLITHNYTVSVSSSGQEALQYLSHSHPDLILSEVELPDGNGLDLCRRIHSETQTHLIPFLFLSTEGDLETRIQSYGVGADDYLQKPVHLAELRAKIAAHMGRNERVRNFLVSLQVTKKRPKAPPTQVREPLPLTRSENKVFWEVAQGFTNRQIGDHLGISPRTVQTHITNMLNKLDVGNRAQLVRLAFEHGYMQSGQGSQPPRSYQDAD
ncbi:response regulator transcription factor [Prochlorothrix hollandica]|uniref:LuxR family transcriptional regulator n=1 Tax=Prochlorothrix hollandica PCC 9006 = CALU 1027 TaxID=317619 RepID=A0A0M2PZX0_PROHO|nr:response regulator transcription factor [Prochlorothrix hollandica]KKJ00244.1 hypothetical protein PROH_11160 [Prochlorothrix hollandica PCC 9006 = CALU 1027]